MVSFKGKGKDAPATAKASDAPNAQIENALVFLVKYQKALEALIFKLDNEEYEILDRNFPCVFREKGPEPFTIKCQAANAIGDGMDVKPKDTCKGCPVRKG